MHKNDKDSLLKVLSVLFILVSIVFTLYPVIYTLLGSLKTNMELTSGTSIFPKKFMFSNYIYAFNKANFAKYSLNSFILSTITTSLALITSSLGGYVFARHQFVGKDIIMKTYTATMFMCLGAVALYPQYIMLHSIGLTKSLTGLAIVLTGGQVSNVLLIMGFVKRIPKELDESAFLDGCGYFQTFIMILMPLTRPILGVVALFAFRLAWNDYITALVFTMSNPKIKPLTVAVVGMKYSINAAAEWNLMAAGTSIALIPILIVYIFTNKQFIAGLSAGAVKG